VPFCAKAQQQGRKGMDEALEMRLTEELFQQEVDTNKMGMECKTGEININHRRFNPLYFLDNTGFESRLPTLYKLLTNGGSSSLNHG
jgi:hypothetical protein